MSESTPIEPGRQVSIHFSLMLEDGLEVENTWDDAPLSFTVGDGTLLPGLEWLLTGLTTDEERTFVIAPEDGFGYRDESNVHDMPREEFDRDMDLVPGVIIGFSAPSGDELPGTVLEADEKTVRVDFNHPLAGHTLTFNVKVLSVE